MSKTSKYGFTGIEIAVIVAVVAILGLLGWRAYDLWQDQNSDSSSSSSQSTPDPENLPAVESTNDLDEAQKAVESVNPDDLETSEIDEALQ